MARATGRRCASAVVTLALLGVANAPAFALVPGQPSAGAQEAGAQEAESQEAESQEAETEQEANAPTEPFVPDPTADLLAEYERALAWLPSEARSLSPALGRSSMRPMIGLNGRLVGDGYLEEASALCLKFSRAMEIQMVLPQRPLALAAQNEIARHRYAAADAILDELEELQQTHYLKGGWAPYDAWERAYYHIARADLAVEQGFLEVARREVAAAEEQYLKPDEAFREGKLGLLRYEIDRLQIDLLLGASRYAEARDRSREALQRGVGTEGPDPEQSAAFLPRLGVALHVLAFSEPVLVDEAREVLAELAVLPAASAITRFGATFRLADLLYRHGDASAAAEQRAAAKGLARSQVEHAMAASLEAYAAADGPASEAAGVYARWRESFDALLDDWRQQPVNSSGSAFLQYASRRYILHAGMRLARALDDDGERRAFELYLETETPSSLARRLAPSGSPAAALTLASIQSTLVADGEVYIVPLANRWGGTVFTVTRDRLIVTEAGGVDVLSDTVRSLRLLLGSPPEPDEMAQADRVDDFAIYGRVLGDALVRGAAIAAVEAASLVTLVDENMFGPIPIELAHVEGGPLGDRVATARCPSFLVEALAARRPLAEPQRDLLLITDTPADGYRVPDAAQALISPNLGDATSRKIVSAFDDVSTWRGRQAGEAAVTTAPLNGVRMLEFVVHGHHVRGLDRSATLLLGASPDAALDGSSGDGLLDCDEVDSLQVPSVVVLATCGGARARDRVGDAGAGDLGGSFAIAGARTIVLARGEVPLDATIELLTVFHEHLADGGSVASALKDARVDLASIPEFADPYYRTQLQVFGDGAFVPFKANHRGGQGPSRWWIALAALVLIGGALSGPVRRSLKRSSPRPR